VNDFWLEFDSATDDPACWSWPVPDLGELDEYGQRRALRRWQERRCAICEDDDYKLVRDHDHVTNLVRGWLCPSCNHAESRVFDDATTNVYAKWRACPATAVLGVRFEYRSEFSQPTPYRELFTGYTYLPEWTPDPNGWPHAFTCDVPPAVTPDWELEFRCGHPHPRMPNPERAAAKAIDAALGSVSG
jgi:hypothetical protein